MPLPVYTGPFGPAEAERLLWRAGFGPRRGEEFQVAQRGLDGAVEWLTKPGQDRLVGMHPLSSDGRRLAPEHKFGHDVLWWLDRMVRTSTPLRERMTLVWHDWFATSNEQVGSQRLMLEQNELFRSIGLGSFKGLAMRVAINPAMLIYLNGLNSSKEHPNENFARELMELFTMGAGNGYTERDIREQARALTGWTADWQDGYGFKRFRFKSEYHDDAMKVVFGKAGPFNWKGAVRLAIEHPAHAPFFVQKLWSYFIPVPPDPETQGALESLYKGSGHEIRPVVSAILRHPVLYEGPRMAKSPAVYLAGMLRSLGDRVQTEDFVWLSILSGQLLFYPPNVSGWNDARWLDTSTFHARWDLAGRVLRRHAPHPERDAKQVDAPRDPAKLVDRALEFWGNPRLSPETKNGLLRFASRSMDAAVADDWRQKTFPVMTLNALRQLIAASPEMQTA